jgi:hypothetical protein
MARRRWAALQGAPSKLWLDNKHSLVGALAKPVCPMAIASPSSTWGHQRLDKQAA